MAGKRSWILPSKRLDLNFVGAEELGEQHPFAQARLARRFPGPTSAAIQAGFSAFSCCMVCFTCVSFRNRHGLRNALDASLAFHAVQCNPKARVDFQRRGTYVCRLCSQRHVSKFTFNPRDGISNGPFRGYPFPDPFSGFETFSLMQAQLENENLGDPVRLRSNLGNHRSLSSPIMPRTHRATS